jgi:hypothetical protein
VTVASRPASPIGTFTQKIADQSKASISAPPRTGPRPKPKPAIVAHIPIAHARRSGSNASTRIDKRERRKQRRADALKRAERDQHMVARGERAAGREQREEGEPESEDALASVAVAERAADQDERGQRQHVRVDGPDERAGGDVQLPLDRGQSHVHDRDVEQDHELGEAGRDQRPALAGGAHREATITAGAGVHPRWPGPLTPPPVASKPWTSW